MTKEKMWSRKRLRGYQLSRFTFDEVFEKCEDELRHYCGEFYSMGIAEDREFEFLILCYKNLYHAKELHKAFKAIDYANDGFESMYG